ncbi:MAG: hypothetical protein JOZ99_01310 [Actinobacteria bacterium]|nr:hypothetical protein [Actinomycetota bacterium]
MLTDLDITTEQLSATCSFTSAPLVDGVRNRAGAASLGFLVTLVDVNCALVALIAADPDWTATADLSLHAVAPLDTGPAVVESTLLRAGRNVVVVSITVFDGRGTAPFADHGGGPAAALARGAFTTVARGLATFARIPRGASAASAAFDPVDTIGRRRSMSPAGGVPCAALTERIGLRVVDAASGVVELPITDYVRNSFGAINGGVLGMVVQDAAEAALPQFAATDVQIHYLAQARAGAARAATTVLRRGAGHAVCAVEVIDVAGGGTTLALATVTLQELIAAET